MVRSWVVVILWSSVSFASLDINVDRINEILINSWTVLPIQVESVYLNTNLKGKPGVEGEREARKEDGSFGGKIEITDMINQERTRQRFTLSLVIRDGGGELDLILTRYGKDLEKIDPLKAYHFDLPAYLGENVHKVELRMLFNGAPMESTSLVKISRQQGGDFEKIVAESYDQDMVLNVRVLEVEFDDRFSQEIYFPRENYTITYKHEKKPDQVLGSHEFFENGSFSDQGEYYAWRGAILSYLTNVTDHIYSILD